MTPFIRSTTLCVTVLALCALAPAAATAGARSYASPYCYKATNGSGHCEGTLNAFLGSADPTASAVIYTWAWPAGYNGAQLNATLNGVSYSCLTTDATIRAALLNLSRTTYFSISWDATGACNYAQVNSVSYYP